MTRTLCIGAHAFLVAAGGGLAATSAQSAPLSMVFDAQLQKKLGASCPAELTDVQASLEDADGAVLWTQHFPVVAVDPDDCTFAVEMAEDVAGVPAVNALGSDGSWLCLSVDGQPLEPCLELTSVPYAGLCLDAVSVGGLPAEVLVTHDQINSICSPSYVGGTCPEGLVAVGIDQQGHPVCGSLPPLESGTVHGTVIEDATLPIDKLSPTCLVGQTLVQGESGWACEHVGTNQVSPGLNLLLNPGFRGDGATGVPQILPDADEEDLKITTLTDEDAASLLDALESAGDAAPRSIHLQSVNAGTPAHVSLFAAVDPGDQVGVEVTCSVWARYADNPAEVVDGLAQSKAKMTCFGTAVSANVAWAEPGAGWVQLSATTTIPQQPAHEAAMRLHGGGVVTGSTKAFVQYALPKLEFGPHATAWNTGISFMSGQTASPGAVSVSTSDTETDLGLQIARLMGRYSNVDLFLQPTDAECTVYTWNHTAHLRPNQRLRVRGPGSNGAHGLSVMIEMNQNGAVAIAGWPGTYKTLDRLRVDSRATFILEYVVLYQSQLDPIPLTPSGDGRALFSTTFGADYPTITLRQLKIRTHENLVNFMGHSHGWAKFGHTFVQNASPTNGTVYPVTASQGWGFSGNGAMVSRSHTHFSPQPFEDAGVAWSTHPDIEYLAGLSDPKGAPASACDAEAGWL